MKKPNITKGEWKLEIEDEYAEVYTDAFKICTDACNEDAKAISAVPEMIYALIESTKLLEHLKSVETEAELLNQIEQQIEMNKYSALKKAGCS